MSDNALNLPNAIENWDDVHQLYEALKPLYATRTKLPPEICARAAELIVKASIFTTSYGATLIGFGAWFVSQNQDIGQMLAFLEQVREAAKAAAAPACNILNVPPHEASRKK